MTKLIEEATLRSRAVRWPWAAASVLLLGAAAAAGGATYLFWLPCRGSMLQGLVFLPSSNENFSHRCLQQMDAGTPFPFASDRAVQTVAGPELGAAAMALTGLAWLVVVLGQRWPPRTTAVAVVPALLSVALAVSAARAAILGGGSPNAYAPLRWWLVLEVAAVVVLVAIRLWQPELTGWQFGRLALILWGVTAFGVVHEALDYITMLTLSDANWDSPPGCGYPTVVVIVVAAVLAATSALRPGRARPVNPVSIQTQAAGGIPSG